MFGFLVSLGFYTVITYIAVLHWFPVTPLTISPSKETLLFFFGDSLERQEIDYVFDVGNYFVNICMDDTPMLFVFSVLRDIELKSHFLLTNKISHQTNNKYINSNLLFIFDPINMKVAVIPDQETVISIKITPC